MPNTIQLAKNYANLLDEVYQNASVTADLTGDPAMTRAGVNADEICYMQIDTTGLGDYSRSSGYTEGAVNLVWKTVRYNYDRGTKISVDAMDDQETFNKAMGAAGATLQRTRVAPEADAFTFSMLAGTPDITTVEESYVDATTFLTALLTAQNTMDEAEVPTESRILYATPTLINSITALDTTKSREVLQAFSTIKKVPQSRFYTAIDLLDGKTAGEEAGHFKKADAGCDINFIVIEKSAIIKHDKHVVGNVILAADNPNADADIVKYRKYGIVDVYGNKTAGIYVSHKSS